MPPHINGANRFVKGTIADNKITIEMKANGGEKREQVFEKGVIASVGSINNAILQSYAKCGHTGYGITRMIKNADREIGKNTAIEELRAVGNLPLLILPVNLSAPGIEIAFFAGCLPAGTIQRKQVSTCWRGQSRPDEHALVYPSRGPTCGEIQFSVWR